MVFTAALLGIPPIHLTETAMRYSQKGKFNRPKKPTWPN